MTDLATTFRKPFAEQVAAFRLRLGNLQPTVRWDDISHAQHDRAFMVAGALKADLLADLAGAVDKAISQGTTLEEFRRDFRAIVEKNGWHGWTGEGTAKGEAWRTRVIYRTNLATSYAAGRRAQLVAGDFKYWVYRHGGSLEPRLQHLAWDGIALPPDHPFWITHAPPNGWGCSCRIFGADSDAGIRRVGGVPGKPLPDGWDRIDPKTATQVGIDKGWGYAPGATVSADIEAMTQKAIAWPYELSRAFMASVLPANRDALSTAFRTSTNLDAAIGRWVETVMRSGSASSSTPSQQIDPQRSLGLLTAAQKTRFAGFGTQIDELAEAVIDLDAVKHVLRQHGQQIVEGLRNQRAVTASDFGKLARLIETPDVIEQVSAKGEAPRFQPMLKIGPERFMAIFEYRQGRRKLALVTFWILR